MVNDTTIHTMPEEVLSIILQMLPPPSKFVAMSVCKRWEKLLRQRRLWRRDRKSWDKMMEKLHTWLKMPPPNEDMADLGEAGELLQATLHKRETAGSFLKLTPNPIPPELRTWLNHYSGQSNTFMRSSSMKDAPLTLNYHCDLFPGFNRFRGNTNEIFLYTDSEDYTWVEGGWSEGGEWVESLALKQIKMFSQTGEHWILEIRMHTAANLPIGIEFVQEARSRDGETLVSSSNIFQKLRSDATTRIEKEMSEDLASERECGVWLSMPVASGAPLRATILGPEGSPYEGGRFEVEITVPRTYPFVSPKCRFLTKIWHPNVDHKTGEVCLVDIPPSLLLIKILIHYQGLLSYPDVDDPMDPDVARQARDLPDLFAATARHWTWTFASPTRPESNFHEKVILVKERLNVSSEEALTRLALVNWQLESLMDVNN